MPRYDPSTALVIVDLQNDFADPSGSLSVAGGDVIVAAVNQEVARAVAAGAAVVGTQDWHPASTPHFAKDGGIWPVHCVGGTWGAALHPDLALPEHTPIVRKGVDGEDGYSGFTVRDSTTGAPVPTGLHALLRERAVDRLVVVGLATDYCVKATALDAVGLGYGTSLVIDAVAAVDLQHGDGDRAIAELRAAGVEIWSPGPG